MHTPAPQKILDAERVSNRSRMRVVSSIFLIILIIDILDDFIMDIFDDFIVDILIILSSKLLVIRAQKGALEACM